MLVTYLLVALNCSYSHGHVGLFDQSCMASHCHADYEKVHHAQNFHVGIFHFLGHLLEELRHIDNDDFENDHLFFSPKKLSKKNVNPSKKIDCSFAFNKIMIFDVDAASLPDPPALIFSCLRRIFKSDSPLRAPPALG